MYTRRVAAAVRAAQLVIGRAVIDKLSSIIATALIDLPTVRLPLRWLA